MAWYRNDKEAVAEALRKGERPDLATTMASGPLDELVALHQELGIFAILDELEVQRARAGVPEDRLLYQDLQGLAAGQFIDWTHHRYLRTIGGHKQLREVEVTAAGELTSWDGFTEAAASYGVPGASLWACLIRDVTTQEAAAEPPRALVSTRRFADGFAALQAFRPRWHIEDDVYRELKEGSWLEKQRWGRDLAAALGRTTLTCLAFNTAQVYRLRAGERLASVAIRRLRRLRQRELGAAPRESLLPALA